MQYFTQETGVCIKIFDFIEESHETAQAISVLNQTWQNMIFLFVKYLYFAHAEEKQEDISFADNFEAVPYFHPTVIILSGAPGNPASNCTSSLFIEINHAMITVT